MKRSEVHLELDNGYSAHILANQGVIMVNVSIPGEVVRTTHCWFYAEDAPGIYNGSQWHLDNLRELLHLLTHTRE